MSGPVDVLAVLDADAIAVDWHKGSERGKQSREARAAVAELIEAAKEMMRQDAVQRATFNTNPFMADAADKLNAALGKVGAR